VLQAEGTLPSGRSPGNGKSTTFGLWQIKTRTPSAPSLRQHSAWPGRPSRQGTWTYGTLPGSEPLSTTCSFM
jgi:hypothetical protein